MIVEHGFNGANPYIWLRFGFRECMFGIEMGIQILAYRCWHIRYETRDYCHLNISKDLDSLHVGRLAYKESLCCEVANVFDFATD